MPPRRARGAPARAAPTQDPPPEIRIYDNEEIRQWAEDTVNGRREAYKALMYVNVSIYLKKRKRALIRHRLSSQCHLNEDDDINNTPSRCKTLRQIFVEENPRRHGNVHAIIQEWGPSDNLKLEPVGGIPTASAKLMAHLMHSTHVLGSDLLRETLTTKQAELAKELRNSNAGKKTTQMATRTIQFLFSLAVECHQQDHC